MGWRDPLRALCVGLTAAALFVLLVQERMPGDSSELVAKLARSMEDQQPFTFWYHLLYAWCAQGLATVLPFLEARPLLEVFGALSAGLALPLAWLALVRLGLPRRAAAGAAALLAVSPFLLQHATFVEVHGFQLATGLAALALVARARDLGPVGLVVTGLVAGLLVNLGHQTGPLLFPGLVLASFWGAGERPLPSAWRDRALRLVAASAGFVAAIALARAATERFSPFERIRAFSDMTDLTAMLVKPIGWSFLWDELLVGLPALLLAAVLGALVLRRRDTSEASDEAAAHHRLALLGLVLVLVPYGFFLFFGERTEGGYFLGHAPGLVLLTGLFLGRPGANTALWTALLVLVSLPLTLSLAAGHSGANERAAARPTEVAELLPDGGTVYSLQYNEHTLLGTTPGLREVNDCSLLRKFIEDTLAVQDQVDTSHLPGVFATQLARRLGRLHAEEPPLVVDWTWSPAPIHYDRVTWPPFLDAIRAELDRAWHVTEHHGRWGVLLELEPR